MCIGPFNDISLYLGAMVISWNEDGVGTINSCLLWLYTVLKGSRGGYYIVGAIESNPFCFLRVSHNVCFEAAYSVWKLLLRYDVTYYYVKADHAIKTGIIFK